MAATERAVLAGVAAEDDSPHLRETCVSSESAWQGKFLDLRRDRVRLPDGSEVVVKVIRPGIHTVIAEDLALLIETLENDPQLQAAAA